ncbi:MAG: hypothetical protein ACRD21_04280, partial [Vicinamibacteria bacterium]
MATLIERVLGRSSGADSDLLLPSEASRDGSIRLVNEGDGRYEIVERGGRKAVTPDRWSQYVYFRVDEALRRRISPRAFIEVEYYGSAFAPFRLQYVSTDAEAPYGGLYKEAPQRWDGSPEEALRWKRAVFPIEDFDPSRFQNVGASFRMELRQDFHVGRVSVASEPPEDFAAFTETAPLPSIRKSPERVYPIWWLFVEITNLCNFHCTFCPDEIMERHRGMMPFEDACKIFDQVAREKNRLGPH